MKKYRVLINKDNKISGEGGEEVTEYDVLIEELIELSDDTDARCEEKAKEKEKAIEDNRKKALDIRNTAMERFGETRKRKNKEDESPKTSRRSSSASELDKENHRIEREEKAAERMEVQRRLTATQEQFNALLSQQTQILKLLAEKMN